MRASRSASSSHAFTCRIASSRAGMPAGKRDRSKPSRFTPDWPFAAERRTRRFPPDAAPLAVVARERAALLFVLRAAVLPLALEDPATPWARLRWAPSDAGRVNVFPHSGQTNSPDFGSGAERLRGLIERSFPCGGPFKYFLFQDTDTEFETRRCQSSSLACDTRARGRDRSARDSQRRPRRLPRREGPRGLRGRDAQRYARDHLPATQRPQAIHEWQRPGTLRRSGERRRSRNDAPSGAATHISGTVRCESAVPTGGHGMASKDKNAKKSMEKKPAQKTLKEKRQAKKAKK